MRHNKAGRKLGRDTGHRRALVRNLVLAIFESQKIQTTVAKAKTVQARVERLITLAKKEGGLTDKDTKFRNRIQVARYFPKGHVSERTGEVRVKKVLKRLFEEIAPRYRERHGGYTRIIKLGFRIGDGADMAQLELV